MKVVVAIDSLKGSLTSLEAGAAIEKGIHCALPDAEVCVRPLADGGEGTVEALALGMGGLIGQRPGDCTADMVHDGRSRNHISVSIDNARAVKG